MISVKGLLRIAWNSLAAVSAILCAALIVLWIRGRPSSHYDFVDFSTSNSYSFIYSGDGDVVCGRVIAPNTRRGFRFGSMPRVRSDHPLVIFNGLSWDLEAIKPGHTWLWGAKDPILGAAFGTLPGLWLVVALVPRRKVMRGHCAACSYDLRATPDRCPECGAVPPKK
jgi:hypothetical protein